MKNDRGLHSYVADRGGVPTLFVNGEPLPAAAYMTYLEQNNDYAAFADAGYRLFSVPVLCAGRWINSSVDVKPFNRGIFDRKGEPDFSPLDASVGRILSACPDAYIFPRVNLSAPLWWIEENPDCADGTGRREALYSERYREAAAGMLREVIAHVAGSGYAQHIVGYQLAGGNTEEWFYFDLNGGLCENAEPAFRDFFKKRRPGREYPGLPDPSVLRRLGPYHEDENLALYLEFANAAVAETIQYLCAAAKEATGRKLAVGIFYGYALEVASPLWGTHALKTLLDSDAVDFISSPNSYIGARNDGFDWTEMYPASSVRLHGKVCMQECDVRTHLTKLLSESAAEYRGDTHYTAPVWRAPGSPERSVAMLRKTFARQLIAGNGFWWFDMWGGWYRDARLLTEIKQMRKIYIDSLTKKNRRSKAQIAVFSDESAFRYMTECGRRNITHEQRAQLGFAGAPYDMYDVCDFEAVYQRYRGVVFLTDAPTGALRRALALCDREKIAYISPGRRGTCFCAKELRAFFRECGAHIYCETDDLFYVGENYFAIHATKAGVKTIYLNGACSYRELLSENGLCGTGDTVRIQMRANETRLFELSG